MLLATINSAKSQLADQLEKRNQQSAKRRRVREGGEQCGSNSTKHQRLTVESQRPSYSSAFGAAQQDPEGVHTEKNTLNVEQISEGPPISPEFGSFLLDPLDSNFSFHFESL